MEEEELEIEIEEFPALSEEDSDRQNSEERDESEVWEPSWEAETGHHFYIRSFKKPTYCQVCQNFIWGLRKQALYCEVCMFTLHEKCLSKLTTACFIPSIVEGHDYNESIVIKHNWLNGNLSIGSRCFVCTKSSQNMSGSFNSYKCSRCNLTTHSDCQNNAPNCSIPLIRLIFCHELMKKSYAKYSPLLIFVNSKSGGQQGPSIIRKFKKLLCAEQVIDLFDHKPVGPLQALEKYVRVPNLKILVHFLTPQILRSGVILNIVCGGDGTACWVWSVLDKMENLPEKVPPIAMIPLGTGNDLARVLNFGGGYENEPVKPILMNILNRSTELLLDRWDIVIDEEDGERKEWVLNNYFSFGLDAKIALKFHEIREENPQLFKSRTINKGFYGTFGLQNIIVHPHTIKELNFSINVDGQEIDVSKHEGLECVVFLNIPSYAGGTNLWGNIQEGDSWSPCSMNDGKLEVIGLNNAAHLVGLQTGLVHGVKLAQGSNITFEVGSVEVQVDGEPFRIKRSKVSISLYKKSNVVQLIKDK